LADAIAATYACDFQPNAIHRKSKSAPANARSVSSMARAPSPIRTAGWPSLSGISSGCADTVSGLRTADYLICADCGVYVAAITGDDARAIVIINALDDQKAFSREPVPVDFDEESREQREARRRLRWMPVEISFD